MTSETNERSAAETQKDEVITEAKRIYFLDPQGDGPAKAREYLENNIHTRRDTGGIIADFLSKYIELSRSTQKTKEQIGKPTELGVQEPIDPDAQEEAKIKAKAVFSPDKIGRIAAHTILKNAGFSDRKIVDILAEWEPEESGNA